MSIEPRYGDRQLLLLALVVLGASAVLGAAIGASRLGLFVPEASSGSLAEAGAILLNNLEIWALLVAVALFQPLGVPRLTPGFLPLWLTDLTVAIVVAFNLIAVGGVVGALGFDAVLRILPHAPLEIGGFLVVLVAYLRARRGELERREAVCRFVLAGLLLVGGALVETFVSGGLP